MDPQKQITPERIMQMAWGYSAPLILEAAIRNPGAQPKTKNTTPTANGIRSVHIFSDFLTNSIDVARWR